MSDSHGQFCDYVVAESNFVGRLVGLICLREAFSEQDTPRPWQAGSRAGKGHGRMLLCSRCVSVSELKEEFGRSGRL